MTTVIQADRLRAASIINPRDVFSEQARELILAGEADQDYRVQAFASHRIAALEEAATWQPIETAPKDGTIIYSAVAIKWKPYKPTSEQARRGIKGRWVESNGYGGWTPCENGEPAFWINLTNPSREGEG